MARVLQNAFNSVKNLKSRIWIYLDKLAAVVSQEAILLEICKVVSLKDNEIRYEEEFTGSSAMHSQSLNNDNSDSCFKPDEL